MNFRFRQATSLFLLTAASVASAQSWGPRGLDELKEETLRRALHGEGPIGVVKMEDAERMFSAALDYLAGRPEIDASRIVVQGRSWSGYWAAVLAYTEKDRILGAVVHGVETMQDFFAYGPRLSLLERGLIDQPSAPMLLVNGEQDTQQPIGDLYLMMKHGDPKTAWVNPVGGHMGRSEHWSGGRIQAEVVRPWLLRQLGIEP